MFAEFCRKIGNKPGITKTKRPLLFKYGLFYLFGQPAGFVLWGCRCHFKRFKSKMERHFSYLCPLKQVICTHESFIQLAKRIPTN